MLAGSGGPALAAGQERQQCKLAVHGAWALPQAQEPGDLGRALSGWCQMQRDDPETKYKEKRVFLQACHHIKCLALQQLGSAAGVSKQPELPQSRRDKQVRLAAVGKARSAQDPWRDRQRWSVGLPWQRCRPVAQSARSTGAQRQKQRRGLTSMSSAGLPWQ